VVDISDLGLWSAYWLEGVGDIQSVAYDEHDFIAVDSYVANASDLNTPLEAVNEEDNVQLCFKFSYMGPGATATIRVQLDNENLYDFEGYFSEGTYIVDYPWVATPGDHRIQGWCDIFNEVTEIDGSNNHLDENPCFSVIANNRSIEITSSNRGAVSSPGEGVYIDSFGSVINIVAAPDSGYVFVKWSGTAVDAEKVVDPNAASTSVLLDDDYTLRANFTTIVSSDIVLIPGGEFEMGAHAYVYNADELPVHPVLVDPFYIGRYEITNEQYCDFLNSVYSAGCLKLVAGIVYSATDTSNTQPYFDTRIYSDFSQIDFVDGIFSILTKSGRDMSNDPVVMVSWWGAKAFCDYYVSTVPERQKYWYRHRCFFRVTRSRRRPISRWLNR